MEPRPRRSEVPYDVETPPGADGLGVDVPVHTCCSVRRLRERDEQKLWFFDQMHNPEPLYPFDLMMPESWLGRAEPVHDPDLEPPDRARHRAPDRQRLPLPEPQRRSTTRRRSPKRAPIFAERARHYFENWDGIYDQWVDEGHRLHRAAEGHAVRAAARARADRHGASTPAAPPRRSTCSAYYSRYLENMHEMAYYHFEMLNLAYGAYLTFLEFCRKPLPGHHRRPRRAHGGRHRRHPLPARRRAAPPRRAARSSWASARRASRRGAGPGDPPQLGIDEAGRAVAGGTRGGQGSLVLLLHRRRLLPCQPGLDRRPAAAVRRAGATTSAGSSAARTWTGRWTRSAPSASGSPTGYRGLLDGDEVDAFDSLLGPVAPGVPVRREPQLLRRALASLDLLQQGARARRGAGRGRPARRRTTTSSSCTATRCTASSTRRRRGGRWACPPAASTPGARRWPGAGRSTPR